MIKNVNSTPRAISTSQISEVFSAFSRWWRQVLHARKKMASERISQRAQLCLRKTVVSHLKSCFLSKYVGCVARRSPAESLLVSSSIPLSSAKAPVSKYQWKKNTGAGNGSAGNDALQFLLLPSLCGGESFKFSPMHFFSDCLKAFRYCGKIQPVKISQLHFPFFVTKFVSFVFFTCKNLVDCSIKSIMLITWMCNVYTYVNLYAQYLLISKHVRFFDLLLKQVKSILKYLYPVPKDDSRRVITFANQDDYISFRYVHVMECNYAVSKLPRCRVYIHDCILVIFFMFFINCAD